MGDDLIEMSKVKADDMDAINQSGAANLLRMNVEEIERLTAENEIIKAEFSETLALRHNRIDHLTARNKLLEAMYEAAKGVDDFAQRYPHLPTVNVTSVIVLHETITAVKTTEQGENDGQ